MQFIQGSSRCQTYFATLEDQVAADNPVRLIDAFTLLVFNQQSFSVIVLCTNNMNLRKLTMVELLVRISILED